MSVLRLSVPALSVFVLLGACKESNSLPFSIEVTPQTITREPGERVEATLTLTSRSGAYSNERVQVDVVQLGGSVIDELTEGDVGGMVEGFMPIDPEMSGLGVRWKRMSWTLASDAPSRQRDFSWVCGDGTTAAFFFVTVDGEPVSAPTGRTWQAVRSDSSLEPAVADVIERELGLTSDRELELLPIGCGEDPDAGPRDGGVADVPDAGDGGDVDGGPGGEAREISGFFANFYGISPDGTIWFLAGNPGNQLYRVGSEGEEATQRSTAEEIGTALGKTVTSYGISQLAVTADGAAVVRVQTDADNCLMIARSESWQAILCEGDEMTDGPVQSFNQWAVVADDTFGFVALMVVQVADLPRLMWVVDTGETRIVSEVARTMGSMPELDTTSSIELIDSLVLSTSGLGGYRMKAFDGTIAVYSDDAGAGPSLLAWMNVRSSPPEGEPVTPPAEVNLSAYSFGNRPIDGLTVNSEGTFAWVTKVIGTDGVLLDGSGIWVSEPTIRNAIPLPGGMLTNTGAIVGIASGFSALPAMQYALLDDGSIVMNGRWRDTFEDVPGQTIWNLRADDVAGIPDPITGTGIAAPDREPGSTLGSDIVFASLGPMVVSSDGAIAFTALLTGTGVDESNNAGIFATTPDGIVMLDRFGEEIELAGTPTELDILDMGSTGVRAPPMPLGDDPLTGNFLSIDVRDTHVVFGPGSDGRGANFGTEGCGIPLYRAGAFLTSSENLLFAVPLPGICL